MKPFMTQDLLLVDPGPIPILNGYSERKRVVQVVASAMKDPVTEPRIPGLAKLDDRIEAGSWKSFELILR
ncbi:hypothetical protein N7512_000324 [Penicillium capsulatum]|nr:hypothetical protein N7512_000324 [Penicillium capsulatum]